MPWSSKLLSASLRTMEASPDWRERSTLLPLNIPSQAHFLMMLMWALNGTQQARISRIFRPSNSLRVCTVYRRDWQLSWHLNTRIGHRKFLWVSWHYLINWTRLMWHISDTNLWNKIMQITDWNPNFPSQSWREPITTKASSAYHIQSSWINLQ